MNEMRLWRVESTILREAYNNVFTINPWYYKLKEKEVRKKMAIDYKEEWEKFKVFYGGRGIALKIDEAKEGRPINLGALMDNWIDDVIESREGLMQAYVRAKIETEIIGGEGGCHKVKLEVLGEPRGTIMISKNAFNTWLKNKKKGGK